MRVSCGPAVSEVVMEGHFAFDRYLVGRDTPLEEIGEFPHVLQFHKSKWVLGMEYRSDAERFETAIGDVLQIFAHLRRREATDAEAQDIVGEGHLTFHSVLQHLYDALFQRLVEEVRLLAAHGVNDFQSELNVGTFVAKDPVRARGETVQQAARPKEIDV